MSSKARICTVPSEFNPETTFEYYDDFTGFGPNENQADNFWSTSTAGVGARGDLEFWESGHPGIFNLEAGTSNGGFASGYTNLDLVRFGTDGTYTYQTLIEIDTLPDGADDYILIIGIADNLSGTAQVDGIYFRYDSAESDNWIGVQEKTSVESTIDSGVAVAPGWVTLRMVMRAADGETDYYINDVKVGTVTSNFPTNTAHFMYKIHRTTAGSNNRVLNIDYMYMKAKFKSLRRDL